MVLSKCSYHFFERALSQVINKAKSCLEGEKMHPDLGIDFELVAEHDGVGAFSSTSHGVEKLGVIALIDSTYLAIGGDNIEFDGFSKLTLALL